MRRPIAGIIHGSECHCLSEKKTLGVSVVKRTKNLTKPKLFIRDLERPAPAKGKATTLAVGEEAWWKGGVTTLALGEEA